MFNGGKQISGHNYVVIERTEKQKALPSYFGLSSEIIMSQNTLLFTSSV